MASTEQSQVKGEGSVFEALDDLAQIAPDGDLILVVGKEGKRGIQVHSLMLKSASPVFEVMLSDKFSEGRRLRESQGPMRLDLPEDDYDAVHNACSVLHGNDGSKKNLTAMEVHMLAVLIDKYDMSERFFFATAYWLRVLQGVARNSFQDCWYLLTAAYILSSETHFFTYSELLGRRVESCANLAYEIEDLELGLKLCLAIEEHRSFNLRHRTGHYGLCLDCFRKSRGSFLNRGEGCPTPNYHRKS